MRAHKPKVSIGLPVYNGENYLEEALDSILSQTFEDFEFIISDNASTDDTPNICKAYADKDPRIRYNRNESNIGVINNFNRVVSLAKGEYFQWMAHDDRLEPERLASCVEILDRYPSVFLAFTKSLLINEHGEPFEESYPMNLHMRSLNPHERWEQYFDQNYPRGGKYNVLYGLMRRKLLASTALYRNYPNSDVIFLADLVLLGEFHEIPETLFVRRIHPQGLTRANPKIIDRAVAMDPKFKGKILFPHWRWFYEYMAILWRASISFSEKLRCLPALKNYYLRYRYKSMIRDVLNATRRIVRRMLRRKRSLFKRRL